MWVVLVLLFGVVGSDGRRSRPDSGASNKETFEVTPGVGTAAFLYHDYQGLTAWAHNVSSTCSDIMQLSSIGKSVQGRELWVMRITKYPNLQKLPEFLYVGNMHGDETVGREVLVHFVQSLCDGYATPQWPGFEAITSEYITQLITTTDIYVLFSMNPDGFELQQRENAHGVDLNRDFPDQFKDGSGSQPETLAVKKFLAAHEFSLGANLHGGAVVCNYPWDGIAEDKHDGASVSPDDLLYRSLCSTYSGSHAFMSRSREFTNGITNGAQWYPLFGGLQDFSYWKHGMLHVTLELSDNKAPPESELEGEWENNQRALFHYLERVHQGVRGSVIRTGRKKVGDGVTVTFQRLERSNVYIEPPPAMQLMRTKVNPVTGQFTRVLLPGTYNATVWQKRRAGETIQLTVPEPRLEGSVRVGVAEVTFIITPTRGTLPVGLRALVAILVIVALGLIGFALANVSKVVPYRYRRQKDLTAIAVPTVVPTSSSTDSNTSQEKTALRSNYSQK